MRLRWHKQALDRVAEAIYPDVLLIGCVLIVAGATVAATISTRMGMGSRRLELGGS